MSPLNLGNLGKNLVQKFLGKRKSEVLDQEKADDKKIEEIANATADMMARSMESAPYIEVGGQRLEKLNQGAPKCPDIEISEAHASSDRPQAWVLLVNGAEHWLYNYPGAKKEAEFLGRKIPSFDQWQEMRKPFLDVGNDKLDSLLERVFRLVYGGGRFVEKRNTGARSGFGFGSHPIDPDSSKEETIEKFESKGESDIFWTSTRKTPKNESDEDGNLMITVAFTKGSMNKIALSAAYGSKPENGCSLRFLYKPTPMPQTSFRP